MPRPSIHVWVPGLKEGSGGIQAFSRMYVRAIAEGFPSHHLSVLVRNDEPPASDPLRALPNVTIHSAARRQGWRRALGFALQGIALAWRERPVCIVSSHLNFLLFMRVARVGTRARLLSVLHGIDVWHLQGTLRRQSLRAADHLMAVSHHTRDITLRDFDLPEHRVSVLPNTFDEERFSPGPKPSYLLARHGLEAHQPVLLTVSRLSVGDRLKGHRQVLVALSLLKDQLPGVRYLIAGSGSDAAELQEAARALGVADAVIFTGQIASEELSDYYRLADVFLMPSLMEGFGIVFLEAMASGKPVVAGHRDGSVDALDGGRLGLLVDPCDATAMAQTVVQILKGETGHPLVNDPLALQAAVKAHFGHRRVAQLMVENLRPWLEKTAPPPSSITPVPIRPKMPSSASPHQAFRVVVLTEYTSPYQIEFFNAIARRGECFIEVVYMTGEDSRRAWTRPPIHHCAWIISEGQEHRWEASQSVQQADLVICNTYLFRFALPALWRRAASGKPWVFWGERPGSLNTGWAGRVLRRWLLRPLRRSQAPIWGIGRFGVEGYQREFGTQRPYVNLSYASDLRRFTDLPLRDPAQRVFFFSGSLTPRKGVDLLAAAFANLAERHPQARLVIAGQGPLETTMRATLSGCAGQVEWLGFVPWDQMPEALAKGSILCLPSRYDGWGLALVEGLAAGLPAISTDQTGSAIELLQAGETGWRVPAGEAAALEQAMEAALELPNDAFAARQQAARAAAQHHGLDASVPRFLEACRAALAPV